MSDPFLANLTHEVRGLLAAVLACTDLLGDSLRDRGEAADLEKVRLIQQHSRHLLHLLNNALDLFRIEAGKLTPAQVPCDAGQMAAEVVALLQGVAAERGLTLAADCAGPIPQTIRTDPLRLRQILLNLLDNALRYTERGEVTLTVELVGWASPTSSSPGSPGFPGSPTPELVGSAHPTYLAFRVRDTGIGISAEEQGRIFEPFVQAEAAAGGRFGGAGLGLAIAQRLAGLLGGRLDLESRPGQGSTFSLILPTGPLDGVAWVESLPQLVVGRGHSARPAGKPGPGPCLGGVRVLVLEDRPDQQLLVAVILKSAGALVTLAPDPASAAARVAEAGRAGRPFGVVLVGMAPATAAPSPALAQRLRQAGFAGALVTLADDRAGPGQAWLDAGFTGCYREPLDAATLLETVAQALSGRH